MKKLYSGKRVAALLIAVLLGILCFSAPASAQESVDLGRKGSLTVRFGENETFFSGVEFSLYRVAEVSETGSFTLTGDFSQYPVALEDLDSSGWRSLAQTLSAYAARDELAPLRTQETGQDGTATFSGLTPGLYLAIGSQYTHEGIVYTPEALLLSLPGLGEDGSWEYDVESTCKFDQEERPGGFVQRKVQKVWDDEGNTDIRPEQIAVQLLKDGTVVDTVNLSQENNWQYTWDNLAAGATWQVVEAAVPDGYTVTVQQEGTTCVLTNTSKETTPDDPPSGDTPRLPQTGLLWWPVPLLALGGAVCLAAGLILRRGKGDSHEE